MNNYIFTALSVFCLSNVAIAETIQCSPASEGPNYLLHSTARFIKTGKLRKR